MPAAFEKLVLCFFAALCWNAACGNATADAQFDIYTDRSNWAAEIGPLSGTEDFNSFLVDTPIDAGPVALNNMFVSGSPGLPTITQIIDALPFRTSDIVTVDGTPFLIGDVFRSEVVRFDFVTPVTAWGADFKDIANLGRNTKIKAYDQSDELLGVIEPSSTLNQAVRFFGFRVTTDSVAYVEITDNNFRTNDAFGIDNIGFVAVPEPSAAMLLVACGLSLARNRKRR